MTSAESEGEAGTEPLAKRVAAAVLAVPGVSGLHGGLFGEVATYLPGDRVSGVALGDDGGEIHIVVDAAHDLRGVAVAVRDVAQQLTDHPVDVTVADIDTAATGAPVGVNQHRDEKQTPRRGTHE